MRFVTLLLFLAWLSSAAYIYGDIYQASTLEKINDSVIKIDGRFSYQMVSTKSNYSLELPEGDYSISAEKYDSLGNLILYAKESVKLGGENQRIDLILKPIKPKDDNILTYALIGVIIVIIIAILFILKNKTKEQKEPVQVEPKSKPIKLDGDAKKVLQALESSEGRSTQKELKQILNFSDAKLSLILTELEESNYIKKFKRGRGNIIRKL